MPGIQNTKEIHDFLGEVGADDRGDSLELGNSARALATLAGVIIGAARDNLEKGGNIATGDTSASMIPRDIVVKGTSLELDIEILSTYKFLNDGVKGTEGGAGKYSFKTSRAGKKMAAAILSWIKTRSLSGKVKYKATSKNERKNKLLYKTLDQTKNRESLSYAIATSIKKRGIKPTKFFTKAIAEARREQKKLFADALKLDIIESLNALN